MPGPAVHNVIGWQLADEFDRRARGADEAGRPERLSEAARVVREYPAHVALGTQGPDFTFFNLADWSGLLSSVPELMVEVSDWLRSIRADVYEAFPVIEEMYELADDVEENSPTVQQFKALSTTLGGFLDAIAATLQTAVKATVLDAVDVFSILSHPIQDCEDESTWWWFDAMHYRKSGQVAAGLLDAADEMGGEEGDKLRAYAIGYLSHVGGDTIGHPYVNTIVRGPYRTYAQRHKTVENYQDAWAYAAYHGEEPAHYGEWDDIVTEVLDEDRRTGLLSDADFEDLTSSRLHHRNHLLSETASEYHLETALPDYVAEPLAATLQALYTAPGDDDPAANGPREFDLTRIGPDELDNAYRLWYRWWRNSTETGVIPRTLPEYDPPSDPLDDRWEEFTEAMEGVGDALAELWNGIKNALSGGGIGKPDFGGLLNLLEKLGEAALASVLLAATALDWLVSNLLAIPNAMIRLVLEAVYQGIYSAYENYHELVALLGMGYPLKHQILRPETRHFVFPGAPDAAGQLLDTVDEDGDGEPRSAPWRYPMRAVARSGDRQYDYTDADVESLGSAHHLVYQVDLASAGDPADSRLLEKSVTGRRVDAVAGPSAYAREWPPYYIDGRSVRDLSRVADGSAAVEYTGDGSALGGLRNRRRTRIDADVVDLLGAVPGRSAADDDAVATLAGLEEPPATAVGLTVEFYDRHLAGVPLPDVNLDGDRGFGYGSWHPRECGDGSLDEYVSPAPVDGPTARLVGGRR